MVAEDFLDQRDVRVGFLNGSLVEIVLVGASRHCRLAAPRLVLPVLLVLSAHVQQNPPFSAGPASSLRMPLDSISRRR